jgi:hypothetical protein
LNEIKASSISDGLRKLPVLKWELAYITSVLHNKVQLLTGGESKTTELSGGAGKRRRNDEEGEDDVVMEDSNNTTNSSTSDNNEEDENSVTMDQPEETTHQPTLFTADGVSSNDLLLMSSINVTQSRHHSANNNIYA